MLKFNNWVGDTHVCEKNSVTEGIIIPMPGDKVLVVLSLMKQEKTESVLVL